VPAAAYADPGEFNWGGPIGAGSTVTIASANGDVFVERSDDKAMSVRALPRGGSSADAQKWVHVTRDGDKVSICVGYDAPCTDAKGAASGAPRIDVAVYVPERVNVNASANAGQVAVEYATGNVNASTTSGDIHVSTTGNVNAASIGGAITIDAPKGAKVVANARSSSGTVRNDFAGSGDSAGQRINAVSQSGNVVIEAV